MDVYTKVLEFFMENGVQLTTDQMKELKSVCEITDEQREYYYGTNDHPVDNYNRFRGKDLEKIYKDMNKNEKARKIAGELNEKARQHERVADYATSGKEYDKHIKKAAKLRDKSYDVWPDKRGGEEAMTKILNKAYDDAVKEDKKRSK